MPTKKVNDIKNKLSDYIWLKIEKERLENLLEKQRTKCEKMTSFISDMPKGNTRTIEDNYIDLIILDNTFNIKNEITECERKMTEIKELIKQLPKEQYKTILSYKYIDGMTYLQIANITNHSLSSIEKSAQAAIKFLANK
jgi:DNA-directed RNA polymerase specialized sigma subunit